ncbi:relaxase domain-containing protein, partial [Salmonella enterica]|uniref:relaxase domain-containing protein n=1 Tax=Salmonella enterica TaxID=28901 RepID=UPI003CE77B37
RLLVEDVVHAEPQGDVVADRPGPGQVEVVPAAQLGVGAGGVRRVKAEGLLVARFDHYDNRAADPNLHTHCAVLNRV